MTALNPKQRWLNLVAVGLLGAAASSLASCEEGPMEEAGETVDQAVDDTADAVDDAADDAANAIDDIGD